MAAQQKPKPTHAIEQPLPPPPLSPQFSPPQSKASPAPPPQITTKQTNSDGKVLTTPAVCKMAMDYNVRRSK